MSMKTMHVGFDDTDSIRGGCTTHIAALLVERLEALGVEFADYPNLIRLNPNVPWKTRGNGALCLRIRYAINSYEKIKEMVTSTVEEQSDFSSRKTEPGVVFFKGTEIPAEIESFSQDAVTKVVTLKHALKLVTKFKAEAVGFKNSRGIIGALAAIGGTLRGDHTYEIIAYRNPENYGLKRRVNEESIFKMEEMTAPYTFNNVDTEKNRVVITPRGPDPILFGIRGETPGIVRKAFHIIECFESVERWVIFRTNQGTDAHLRKVDGLASIRPFNPVVVEGIVCAAPRIVPRRHVVFSIKVGYGQVDCAAYEPTGALRRAARELAVGDQIEACGGVRASSSNRPLTINLEKIRVLKLEPNIVYANPVCAECGKRLESMGRNQGYRCDRCGAKYIGLGKIEVRMKRQLKGGVYITSTRSQRHLTKPLRRYGMEKTHGEFRELGDCWHFP